LDEKGKQKIQKWLEQEADETSFLEKLEFLNKEWHAISCLKTMARK